MVPFVVDDPARSIAERGYAYVPGVLDPAVLRRAADAVWEAVAPAGWSPAGAADEWRVEGYLEGYRLAQRVEAAHAVGASPALLDLAQAVFGPARQVFGLPSRILRFAQPAEKAPDGPTAAHQDWYYVQGSPDTLTVWIPFTDVGEDMGGLKILSGSHAAGPQPPIPEERGGFRLDTDALPYEWHGGAVAAGDVLVFHCLTVHAGTPNRSGRVRLSMDVRFQPVDEPVAARSLQPHYFPGEWDDIAAGWSDPDLAFGWQRLGLITEGGDLPTLEAMQARARDARLVPAGRR